MQKAFEDKTSVWARHRYKSGTNGLKMGKEEEPSLRYPSGNLGNCYLC